MAPEKILNTIETLEELANSVPAELREDDALRQRLLNAVQKLVPEVETPAEMSQRLLYVPCEIMGAKIGVDLDVFSMLADSKEALSTEQLTERTGAEPALLSRLLQYMASVGQVKEAGTGEWSASNTTRVLADRNFAAGVNHKHDNVMPGWHTLPSWLKRRGYKTPITKEDTPFAQGHGASPDQSFFGWLKEHPANAKEFNLFMGVHRTGEKTWLDQKELGDALLSHGQDAPTNGNKDGNVAFVDIGGGIGHQCLALKEKYPELAGRIVLQDLPEVVRQANVGDAINAMGVNFFDGQPVKGARVYYLRSILRNWPDGESEKILGHIRDAMAPDSLLYIDEIVLPNRGAGKLETQLDMTMLCMLNGEARTESHWYGLLEGLGFKVKDIVMYQNEGCEGIIVASKA
ncbi:S-adenosyl-L-methionine-dependent methyltransferase [Massariosphaeria phaeospora]|uniref:S-adenosyl-L-methionine-dependent methyltransferase n=1 Tax=Massariosphaeria phaeospora TaxID=100035 RepID=A0A7C8MD50_9PLEO|nr:S-adenosyl-L-methionine-dependent methyltransferase [Massariosphaeria phaeospora]